VSVAALGVVEVLETTLQSAPKDDRWSDAALCAAWSRGESIVSLARAYAAATPAITLAGAMARVREVITRYSAAPATHTVNAFPVLSAPSADHAKDAAKTPSAVPAGCCENSIGTPLLHGHETRSAVPAEIVAGVQTVFPVEVESLDTSYLSNDHESEHDFLMSSLGPDDEVDEVDEVDDGPSIPAITLLPAQIDTIIAAIQEDDHASRTTRIGRSIRGNWRKGFNLREQIRVLGRTMPDADDDMLKHMVDAAILPHVLLEQGELLPHLINAVFGMPSDAVVEELLEQVLSTVTRSKGILRGFVHQRTLNRLRRYLAHSLTATPAPVTEVRHAA
jgi:hypothetical protein